MELEALNRAAIAARSFTATSCGATFQMCALPDREYRYRTQYAPDGAATAEAVFHMLVEGVIGWDDKVTVGMLTLTDDPTPVPFSADACRQLFAERPDVLDDVATQTAEFIGKRRARMAEERKNSKRISEQS